MCQILEEMRNEAEQKARTEDIRSVMRSFEVDAEKAMDALRIPANERPMYAARL